MVNAVDARKSSFLESQTTKLVIANVTDYSITETALCCIKSFLHGGFHIVKFLVPDSRNTAQNCDKIVMKENKNVGTRL